MYLLCAIIDVPAHGPVNCVNPNRCMMSEVGFKQEVQWTTQLMQISEKREQTTAQTMAIY